MTKNLVQRCTAMAAAAGMAAGAMLGAAPAAADPGVNYVDNAGFEAGYLGQWHCNQPYNPIVSSPVNSGAYALRGARVTNSWTECWYTTYLHPDRTYELSAAVRGNLIAVGARSQRIGDVRVVDSSPGAFKRISTSFVGTDAGEVPVTIYVRGFAGYGEFFADDFALHDVTA